MSFLLEGPERRQLREIFGEAFDRDGLARALEEASPSRRFEELVADRPFAEQLAQLIEAAEREGWLDDLGRLLERERAERTDLVEPALAVIDRARERAATTLPRGRRTLLNFGLASLAALLAVAYFFLHLEPLWARLGLFGVILVASVSIIWALWGRFRPRAETSRLRDAFEQGRTTWLLGAVCAALLVLGLTTSSLFLLPGSFAGDVDRVAVTSELGLEADFSGAGDAAVGRIFFGRLRPRPVAFVVEEPAGYRLTGTLRPGLSLRRRLPDELETLTVVRVLAGPRLLFQLPRPEVEVPRKPYRVELAVAGREVEPVTDLRRPGFYLAADEDQLAVAAVFGDEVLSQGLARRLTGMGLAQADQESILEAWRWDPDRPTLRISPRLSRGATITARVLDPEDRTIACASESFDELEGGRVRLLLLEENDDC